MEPDNDASSFSDNEPEDFEEMRPTIFRVFRPHLDDDTTKQEPAETVDPTDNDDKDDANNRKDNDGNTDDHSNQDDKSHDNCNHSYAKDFDDGILYANGFHDGYNAGYKMCCGDERQSDACSSNVTSNCFSNDNASTSSTSSHWS